MSNPSPTQGEPPQAPRVIDLRSYQPDAEPPALDDLPDLDRPLAVAMGVAILATLWLIFVTARGGLGITP